MLLRPVRGRRLWPKASVYTVMGFWQCFALFAMLDPSAKRHEILHRNRGTLLHWIAVNGEYEKPVIERNGWS